MKGFQGYYCSRKILNSYSIKGGTLMETLKKLSNFILLQAIIYIALGIALLISPQATITTIIYIIAAYLTIQGILNLIQFIRYRKDSASVNFALVVGVVQIVIAILLFTRPMAVASLFPIAIGIIVLINSISNISRAFEIKKDVGAGWIPVLLFAIGTGVAAIIMIAFSFQTTIAFAILSGILLIVSGIVDIVTFVSFRTTLKDMNK